MSYASSRAWALKETFRGFRQNFSLFSLATFLSALALSIPLFISTIFYELAEPIRQIPTSVEITVFTKSGTDMGSSPKPWPKSKPSSASRSCPRTRPSEA